MAALGAGAKRLAVNAAMYLVPNILVRGITLLLTPLYTRVMAPAEFAIVALANTLTTGLGIVMGLALHACIPRIYYQCTNDDERRRFFGTLLTFTLIVPPAMTAVLYALGNVGLLDIFETIRFAPHLQIVLGTALSAAYVPLPVSVYMAREEPAKVGALNAFSALSQLALTLLFVVTLHKGATGVLLAGLLSGGLTAAISIVLMLRMSALTLEWAVLGRSLAYAVPLVPHLLSNWILSLSDRLILERNVSRSEVGLYSLGYLFNFGVTLFASSVTTALGPMAYRRLKADRAAADVPPLGTYALGAIVFFGLGAALLAPETLRVLAPPTYRGALAFVPWVVLGAVFQGVYFIWLLGTGFSMKTSAVPFVTLSAAALNVALNVIFIPKFGTIVAAVTTAVSYGVGAALHGAVAHRLFPIAWEYRRWALLFLVAGICYATGAALHTLGLAASLMLKSAILSLMFPGLLVSFGFLTEPERTRARALLRGAILR